MDSFYNWLKSGKPIIADGAMGTMLYSLGVPKGHCYDELNISRPEIVAKVHCAYAQSGAFLIETNTFGANRFILDKYYDLGEKTFAINAAGAKIARQSCPNCFIAGSVGPITRPQELAEKPSRSEMARIFNEQITALVSGGVDLIILETFADLDEALIAFQQARQVNNNLPIIVLFSFTPDGLTLTGVEPGLACKTLIRAGAKIIGANCSSGPQSVLTAIKKMALMEPDFLCAMPNAGQARFQQGRFIYPHNPDYFAYYAQKFIQYGVAIVGGCCGTTPNHIQAIAFALKGLNVRKPAIPSKAKRRVKLKIESAQWKKSPKEVSTALKNKTLKQFVIILEIEPPRGVNLEPILAEIKQLTKFKIDAVSISDSPMAKVRMNPLPLAYRIKKEIGLDVILHITCRDRNLIGLQSDLLAAYALGIENILALTGDPPSVGDYPYAAVYEVTATGLIEIAQKLNQGVDGLGNPLAEPTGFWIGAAANWTGDNLDSELTRLKTKLKAGAGFIMTQPVFDLNCFNLFLKHIKPFKIPVFAGVMPLTSTRFAEYLKNEVPGMKIPDETINELRGAGRDTKKVGIAITKNLIQQMRNLVAGVCLMMPRTAFGDLKAILAE